MKVSFVRTKPEEPIKTQFKDLVPGEWYTTTPCATVPRQKLRGCHTHDGYIEEDSYVFFTEVDWTEVYPVSQPEPPKPSWDDFKDGDVALCERFGHKYYFVRGASQVAIGLLEQCNFLVTNEYVSELIRKYTLIELFPHGSGYLKIEI